MEEIEDIERSGFERFIFLQNIKHSSFRRTKKLYWRKIFRGFWGFIWILQI